MREKVQCPRGVCAWQDKHVVLVGFMAAGKTTVGAHLADMLGRPFVDSDALIVARHGSIADLFAASGEDGFRRREYAVVRELLGAPASVIALGGGGLTYSQTQAAVAERGVSVYLDVPLATLVARLRRSAVVRPLLGPQPTIERVRRVLGQRQPLYRQADLIVQHPPRGTPRRFAHLIALALTPP